MLLNVSVDTCLTRVSTCHSGVSSVELQEKGREASESVSVEKLTPVATEVAPSPLDLCLRSPVNSVDPELREEQSNRQENFKSTLFLADERQVIPPSDEREGSSSAIQEDGLELIKGAVEKVLRGDESSSEGEDEVMDTDSGDNLQHHSSDSLSDVTPENENLDVATSDCIFVCPNFDRTVIILDWDDTLLSSSWLASEGLKIDETQELPETVRRELSELENLVLGLLMECSKHGIVSIVTNAETGWVELSSKKFIPRVSRYIEEGVRVVSARSNFEKEFPDSPAQWKEKAFLLELGRLPVDLTRLNLLVLGDSWNERDAGHVAGNVYIGSHVKSVKFVERPTIEQLKRQLSLIISSLHHLCDHEGSFDVNMVC
ncbi:hypothetical protein GAYE_SCF00G1678 [Galdieria yellowstonensis]|uniref:Uncharacterized protein n=1 Tax=Galdieria yellowstonensis TaxID=3028027 RepID=A0AAV9I8R2_9RHOD|nr:hypothetical protein GAYE_SCF00G1678 [Galdieria yellowstonensis]